MIVLVVWLSAWVAFRLLALSGRFPAAASLVGSLRFALAVLFTFTGAAHFAPTTRADMIRMVPPLFPAAEHLVTLTGILEILGAVGLLWPATTRAAAFCLMALLVAMFPANVHAARAGLIVGGEPATPLLWRVPLQLVLIAALWWVTRPAVPPPVSDRRRDRRPLSRS